MIQEELYGKSAWQVLIVIIGSILFLLFRKEFIQCIESAYDDKLGPKAKRFAEQVYYIVYYTMSTVWGLRVLQSLDKSLFQTADIYEGYPHVYLNVQHISYYLTQSSFWLSQVMVMVLGWEEKRSDYQQLVFHHVVTLSLIVLSYICNFTVFGVYVFITMDATDVLLSLSKSLKYLGSEYVGVVYGVFVLCWVGLRHVLNGLFLWSIVTDEYTKGVYGLDVANGVWKSLPARIVTFVLLLLLQGVNLYWLWHIVRIGVAFVRREKVYDERSDDED